MIKFFKKDLIFFRSKFINLCKESFDFKTLRENLLSIHGFLKLLVLVTHLGGYHITVQKLLDNENDKHYFLGSLCEMFMRMCKQDKSLFNSYDVQEFSTNIIRYVLIKLIL